MSFTAPIGRETLAGNKRKQQEEYDRFIPSRRAMKKAMSHERFSSPLLGAETTDLSLKTLYARVVLKEIFPYCSSKILLHREPAPYTLTVRQKRPLWEFPQMTSRILDLPEIVDNFYYNNLD